MVIPVAVLVVATFALLAAGRDTTDALNAERRAAALRTAYELVLVDMTDAESATRGYVLTGELVPRAVYRGHRSAGQRHDNARPTDGR